jgi:ATP-dependent DNA helicase PIF1
MVHIELEKIYRQSNLEFIKLLNAIRDNSINYEQIKELNTRCQPNFIPTESEKYIYLMTTNKAANEINEKKLKQLPGKEKVFTAQKIGNVSSESISK